MNSASHPCPPAPRFEFGLNSFGEVAATSTGAGVRVLSTNDPVRIYQEFATVDGEADPVQQWTPTGTSPTRITPSGKAVHA
ncbi:hypothetical protein IFT73_01050 [Aeromicrobium sp. CFBP 8757]|uniref:hypothetical protein n=1 Tax=Aeromicrobium sp. CFBP 8757 TaxID=2775288 RepID=UPI00177E83B2|nr:hypothetical protein [Aeromicrobium sp. CFBP 8757]MBD8605426.1 hypothetical protein [Aeromicrobium sp. CFBP 8757]